MKQITEDYVSYEVAKLLKEKRFGVPVQRVYSNKGEICETYCDYNNQYKYYDWLYPCASQSLALKWLREVYNIHCTIDIGYGSKAMYFSNVYSTKKSGALHNETGYYNSYEEAVEAALLYVLKNLI